MSNKNCRALMVIEQPVLYIAPHGGCRISAQHCGHRPPSYGHRTLIEKVTAYYLRGEIYFDVREVAIAEKKTAYRVSSGEIIGRKKHAIKEQRRLDLHDRIDLFISSEVKPFKRGDIEYAPLEQMRHVLKYFDAYINKIPLSHC